MKGLVYRIVSPSSPLVYIGSTIKTLGERFSRHKSGFKNGREKCTSHQLLMLGDAKIELISEHEVPDRYALYQLEWAMQAATPCLNYKDGMFTERRTTFEQRKSRPIVVDTPEAKEWRDYMRAYRAKNKEKAILQSRKDASKCNRRRVIYDRQCRAFYHLGDLF